MRLRVYGSGSMQSLSRALVFALVLASSGIFQPLACGAFAEAGCCADEREQHADSSDCRTECGICIACPLSAAPSIRSSDPIASAVLSAPLASPVPAPPGKAHLIPILQPPDA